MKKFLSELSNKHPQFLKFYADYAEGKVLKAPNKISFTGSEFQKSVLSAVCRIPYGQTASYQDIAKAVGKPRAVRAVASTIARNNLHIVIPCHRVIRSDGSPGKYNAGEKIKIELLKFEKAVLADNVKPLV
jgi:O-6-methylguanine DNA methyltransferase